MCRSTRFAACVAILTLGACGGPAAPPSDESPIAASIPQAPVPEPTPAPVPTPVPAAVPTVTLALNTPVALTGEDHAVALLRDYTIEEIAPAPGHTDAYPAGSGVTMTVEIAGATAGLSELSAGYESAPVGWTSRHKITLVRHDPGSATALVHIEKITDTIEETLYEKAHVLRRESLALGPHLKAEFSGHGHKMVYPGQTSPLMVAMRYLRDDQELESASYNLYPPDDNVWTWRNVRFSLLAHEYDGFMDLRVERLGLEPLEASPR